LLNREYELHRPLLREPDLHRSGTWRAAQEPAAWHALADAHRHAAPRRRPPLGLNVYEENGNDFVQGEEKKMRGASMSFFNFLLVILFFKIIKLILV
jgi:hypothetical protein